mgnify:CR=1 FL=1
MLVSAFGFNLLGAAPQLLAERFHVDIDRAFLDVDVVAPDVIEQLRPGTGNLRKLYHQFSDPGAPFVGTRAAIKAMIGRESEPPYERPPLSKEYFAREKTFDRLYIRPPHFWGEKGVDLIAEFVEKAGGLSRV